VTNVRTSKILGKAVVNTFTFVCLKAFGWRQRERERERRGEKGRKTRIEREGGERKERGRKEEVREERREKGRKDFREK
jgi:hypothetical protein